MPRPRTRRRYGANIRKTTVGMTEGTYAALEKLIPDGQRSEFIEAAVRAHLTRHLRNHGAGDIPAERLVAMATTLEEFAEELKKHAGFWGDPLDDLDLTRLAP
jgi:hypothetical protein